MGCKFVLYLNGDPVEVDPNGFFRVVRSLSYLFKYNDDIDLNFDDKSIDFTFRTDFDNELKQHLLGRIYFI